MRLAVRIMESAALFSEHRHRASPIISQSHLLSDPYSPAILDREGTDGAEKNPNE